MEFDASGPLTALSLTYNGAPMIDEDDEKYLDTTKLTYTSMKCIADIDPVDGVVVLRGGDMIRNIYIEVSADGLDRDATVNLADIFCDSMCLTVNKAAPDRPPITNIPLKLNNAMLTDKRIYASYLYSSSKATTTTKEEVSSSSLAIVPLLFDLALPIISIYWDELKIQVQGLWGNEFKRGGRIIAGKTMAMAFHERLGSDSPLAMLPQCIAGQIASLCSREEPAERSYKLRIHFDYLYLETDQRRELHTRLTDTTIAPARFRNVCYEPVFVRRIGLDETVMVDFELAVHASAFIFMVEQMGRRRAHPIKNIAFFMNERVVNKFDYPYLEDLNWKTPRKCDTDKGVMWLRFPISCETIASDLSRVDYLSFMITRDSEADCRVTCYAEIQQRITIINGHIHTTK